MQQVPFERGPNYHDIAQSAAMTAGEREWDLKLTSDT